MHEGETYIYLLIYSPLSTFLQVLHLKQPRCHWPPRANRACPFLMSLPQPAQSESTRTYLHSLGSLFNAPVQQLIDMLKTKCCGGTGEQKLWMCSQQISINCAMLSCPQGPRIFPAPCCISAVNKKHLSVPSRREVLLIQRLCEPESSIYPLFIYNH